VQLPWPQTSERRRIAALLRTLDDKIDSNRRLAWLLEETAGVLFRARFVDFVGVDEFEEAEIGRVPKGWGVGTLGDLATTVKHTVKPGDNPEHLFEHFGILDFDAGRRPDVVPGGQLLSGKTLLPDRDCLLVSKLNPATRRVWWARPTGSHTAISSPEFLVLVPRDGVPITYLYSVVGHDEGFYGELLSHVGGTTGSRQRVKPDAALGCRVLVPSTSELEGWDLVVRPLYDRAAATISESATLASVRDALLPKLISGEMRVPDTQDAAEVIKPVVEGLGTFA
jgi:type I restriction enzyme S subunit